MSQLGVIEALAGTVEFNVDYKISTGDLTPRTAIQYLRGLAKDKSDFGGIKGTAWSAAMSEVRHRIQAKKRKSV